MDFVIKKETSSNRTVRMPDELIEEMCRIAAAKNISFNRLVVQCCRFALENLKDE